MLAFRLMQTFIAGSQCDTEFVFNSTRQEPALNTS